MLAVRMPPCLTKTRLGCPPTMANRPAGYRLTASVSALHSLQSTAVPLQPPGAVGQLWEFLRARLMRVVDPSTTPGRVRIYRDDQAPTTQPLQGLKGPRKWARVHAAEKIVPEVDAVSHHCHAKRREMSESLLRRPGWYNRLRRTPAQNRENAALDRSLD